uniref:Uncharacterized protein n=1 Tax=Amphimedon queenslandica TaxID=400682 RepID=A0A1X7TLK2_AMPQE
MNLQMDQKLLEKMKTEAKTNEAMAILMRMDQLHSGLSASILTIASKCYAKGMIDEDIYDWMFDGEWKPDNARAQLLVRCIEKRLKEMDATNVGTTIRSFAEVIRKEGSLGLEQIAQQLDSCKTAEDFRDISDTISTGIASSLTTIAMGAVANGIISFSECVACTQGDATAEARRTQLVLQQIFHGAAENPKVLYDFMKILEKKGKPISNQCDGINMVLRQLSANTGQEGIDGDDDADEKIDVN